MITVSEAARKAGRDPETIRRWIRTGKLPARNIGARHVIEERDLDLLIEDRSLPVPERWRVMPDGRPVPKVVRAVRLSRVGR